MKHCSSIILLLALINVVLGAPLIKSNEPNGAPPIKSNELKLKVEYEFDLGQEGYKVMYGDLTKSQLCRR